MLCELLERILANARCSADCSMISSSVKGDGEEEDGDGPKTATKPLFICFNAAFEARIASRPTIVPDTGHD